MTRGQGTSFEATAVTPTTTLTFVVLSLAMCAVIIWLNSVWIDRSDARA